MVNKDKVVPVLK